MNNLFFERLAQPASWINNIVLHRILTNRKRREAEAQRKWNVFANILAHQELLRLSVLHGGFNYRLPLPVTIIEDNVLKVNVEFQGPIISYKTDGEEPSRTSVIYSGPVEVSGTVRLKAFDKAGRLRRTVVVEWTRRWDSELLST